MTDPPVARSCVGCKWLTPLVDGPTRQHCNSPSVKNRWSVDWANDHRERALGCWTAPEEGTTPTTEQKLPYAWSSPNEKLRRVLTIIRDELDPISDSSLGHEGMKALDAMEAAAAAEVKIAREQIDASLSDYKPHTIALLYRLNRPERCSDPPKPATEESLRAALAHELSVLRESLHVKYCGNRAEPCPRRERAMAMIKRIEGVLGDG